MTSERKSLVARTLRALAVALALGSALVLGFAATLWIAGKAHAEPLDGIAALVDDQVILRSEVEEQFAMYAAQSRIAPGDTTGALEVKNEILDRLIDEKLVLAEAKKQGITASDADIESGVDDAIADTKQRIGSEEQFQLELKRENMTLEDLKERYRGEVRKQILTSRLIGKEIRNKVEIADSDVDVYYEKHRAEFPKRPEQMRLRHILIVPKPAPTIELAALAAARTARERIAGGEDFGKVAAELSADPSSRFGGDIGTFQRGDLEAPFDSAAFSIGIDSVSAPIRTSRGYHVVQVYQRENDQASVRHILIPITIGDKERFAAVAQAETLMARARRGEPFEELARRYSDEPEVREAGGDIGSLPLKGLREPFLGALQALAPGGISEVISDDRGQHIFQLVERVPERDYELDEIREELRQLAHQEKLEAAYQDWIANLRKSYFVEKRPIG
jgi:peptidyl-prolyl cis-trans isomerase SurA